MRKQSQAMLDRCSALADKSAGARVTESMTNSAPIDQEPTFIEVGEGNAIYWEEAGNPDGVPALILHGGPGSGSSPVSGIHRGAAGRAGGQLAASSAGSGRWRELALPGGGPVR